MEYVIQILIMIVHKTALVVGVDVLMKICVEYVMTTRLMIAFKIVLVYGAEHQL